MTKKICIKCQKSKDLNCFPLRKDAKDGYRNCCKKCTYHQTRKLRKSTQWKEKRNAWRRNHRKKNPKQTKNYSLKEKKNIDFCLYQTILKSQQYSCAGCNTHYTKFSRYLAVDHCHQTNQVRGLLCLQCNTALGSCKDSPQILRNLATYIEQKPGWRN